MALTDKMVLQGQLSVDQAVKHLEGKSYTTDLGPKLKVLTPNNIRALNHKLNLAPANNMLSYYQPPM